MKLRTKNECWFESSKEEALKAKSSNFITFMPGVTQESAERAWVSPHVLLLEPSAVWVHTSGCVGAIIPPTCPSVSPSTVCLYTHPPVHPFYPSLLSIHSQSDHLPIHLSITPTNTCWALTACWARDTGPLRTGQWVVQEGRAGLGMSFSVMGAGSSAQGAQGKQVSAWVRQAEKPAWARSLGWGPCSEARMVTGRGAGGTRGSCSLSVCLLTPSMSPAWVTAASSVVGTLPRETRELVGSREVAEVQLRRI